MGVKGTWRGVGAGTLSGLTSPSPNPPPDMKWKNKFWGKSLEIVPVGTVNVSLPRWVFLAPGPAHRPSSRRALLRWQGQDRKVWPEAA